MTETEPKPKPARWSRWWYLGGAVSAIALASSLLVLLWDWNWFRPMVEARLSAAMGRPVTIGMMQVNPGRVTGVTMHGVRVASAPGFGGADFITIPRLSVAFRPLEWWKSGNLSLLALDVDRPELNIEQAGSGQGNWPALSTDSNSPALEIEALAIHEGAAHVHVVREQSDVTMSISTSHTSDGEVLVIDGKGTHARQPITFHAVGGSVLALRDPAKAYPIDLSLANGPTRVTLKGHIQNPLALTGADLDLVLQGPDMALLYPLTGIATPETPSYRVTGRLAFQNGHVKFSHIEGRVGSSDLGGELDVDPSGERPVLTAALMSHQVDLADLGGFVGSKPGRLTTPGQTAKQTQEVAQAEASPKLLPTKPISVPKLLAADVHLTYRGEKIIGKNVPFDAIDSKMDIVAGHIRLAPLRLGIGGGTLAGTIDLMPVGDQVDADADVVVQHVNIGRLLVTAGLGDGQGSIDGTAKVKGKGASLSGILAHGDGALRAVMPNGGNINSLLVDLLGIEVGKALFAAIGLPNKEAINCALADFALQNGILASRALEVNTSDHVITGGGRIDLSREVLEMTLRTDPKSFTIGSLPTPVVISGSLKDLHYGLAPNAMVRGGAAIGLGILFPPAAILPTIQFGVGQGSPCAVTPGQKAAR